jgi:hypothetical protein
MWILMFWEPWYLRSLSVTSNPQYPKAARVVGIGKKAGDSVSASPVVLLIKLPWRLTVVLGAVK